MIRLARPVIIARRVAAAASNGHVMRLSGAAAGGSDAGSTAAAGAAEKPPAAPAAASASTGHGHAHTPRMSFIDKAKVAGANALLGSFVTTGSRFDRTLEGMKVESLNSETGTVRCSLKVHQGVENAYATLHGGAVATIIDVVGTLALLSKDVTKAGVSVELNVSFLSAAKSGETVIAEGRVLKMGQRLGFTEVELRNAADGRIVATGRHTKAF